MDTATALDPVMLAPSPSRRDRVVRTVRAYTLEAHAEWLGLVRQPGFTIPAIAFPAFFYLVFGVALGGGSRAMSLRGLPMYLIATYSAFGIINTGLHAFGMGVALDRGLGWLTVKRASPMPPFAYFTAKLATSLLFGLTTFALLAALGIGFGGVRLPLATWALLAVVLMAGSIPFAAMGVAVGYLASPRSAGAMITVISLPWALASGLWIPIEALPAWWQRAAVAMPPYHYAQLVLRVVGADRGMSPVVHVAVLVAFAIACLLVAWVAYRRTEEPF